MPARDGAADPLEECPVRDRHDQSRGDRLAASYPQGLRTSNVARCNLHNYCAETLCMCHDGGMERPNASHTITLDSKALQVLAHPLRSRLLTALRMNGPATATALAKALDTNTGATSYHLRKLAEVGLVEETDEGHGRERWWRAATEMHRWSDLDLVGDPDAQAASAWLKGHYLRNFVERAETWLAVQDQWPVAWRDASGSSDYVLRLSAARTSELLEELYAVIERYRLAGAAEPRDHQVTTGRPESVQLYIHVLPQDTGGVPSADEATPPSAAEGGAS